MDAESEDLFEGVGTTRGRIRRGGGRGGGDGCRGRGVGVAVFRRPAVGGVLVPREGDWRVR